jgi:hypothetical protein
LQDATNEDAVLQVAVVACLSVMYVASSSAATSVLLLLLLLLLVAYLLVLQVFVANIVPGRSKWQLYRLLITWTVLQPSLAQACSCMSLLHQPLL